MPRIVQKISIIAALVTLMGGSLTFIMTLRILDWSEGFISAWLTSFIFSILCIAPMGGGIAFLVNRCVNLAFPQSSERQKNVIFGLCMAVIMESIMAAVTTFNLNEINQIDQFTNIWYNSFITALPAGLIFSVLLSLVIKPKLAAFWAA